MYIKEKTLDDVLNKVLSTLLKLPFNLKTTKGFTSELISTTIEIENPRKRISRSKIRGKIFSAFGELLWYLSKGESLDFISYYISSYSNYSEDGETIYGAYGKRLFNFRSNINQIQNVTNLLKDKPNTRRAVIQIFDSEDIITKRKEIPCTCTLQFFIRNNKLILQTHMRSNDAYIGLPHDIFCFTMIQEIIASSLKIDIGSYIHSVGSLHLYKKDEGSAREYLSEGFQSTNFSFKKMPFDPWDDIALLLKYEEQIRTQNYSAIPISNMKPYWADFARLILIHSLFKRNGSKREIVKTFNELNNKDLSIYVKDRLNLNNE